LEMFKNLNCLIGLINCANFVTRVIILNYLVNN